MNQDATHGEHRLEYAALSDVGLRREKNQDSLHVEIAADKQAWLRKGHLFIVADGMGAHAAGELASKLAVDRVSETYLRLRDCSPPEAMVEAVRDANTRIFIQGQANRDCRGMGTTVSALTPCAIMSSISAACCCGSACAGPTWKASLPVSEANFLTPSSMRLNHWMPAILTTVAIFLPSAIAGAEIANAEPASSAPASKVTRFFI